MTSAGTLIEGPPCWHCGSPQEPYRLYSSEEAADILGGPAGRIGVGTVNVWRRTGYVREYLRIGRGYYYTEQTLQDTLRQKGYENRILNNEAMEDTV